MRFGRKAPADPLCRHTSGVDQKFMNHSYDLLAVASRLAMVASMYVLLRTFSRWTWLYIALRLPGTVAHEFSHLLFGLIFHAQPVGISFWPRRVPGTNNFVLGHVSFRNLNWWKKLPVATAPLLILFPLGCWLVLASLSGAHTPAATLLICFGAVQCFIGCWPSAHDWLLARTGIYVVIGLFLSIAAGVLLLLR